MTGVYEHALGADAADLHPKVRERYGIGPDDAVVCVGRGELDITRGTLALPALYAMPMQNLLFPESGEDVPFTVKTVGFRNDAGYEVFTTRRAFHFDATERRFDTLTVWDEANDRLVDFLGTDGHLVSELRPRVEDGVLVVQAGRQWIRLGGRFLRLPGPFAANVAVRDWYDDEEEQFNVTAVIENALAGQLLSYRGTFTQEMEPLETVPDDLRPSRGVATLPPP